MNKKRPKIKYADIWGLREEKYKWLEEHDVENTQWQEIGPKDPYYFFVPKEEKGWEEYEKFWKLPDIFPLNSVGVVTGRDDFVIDENKRSLETRIRNFVESEDSIEFIKNAYDLKDKPASNWFVEDAREKLKKDENWEKCFTKILYRPFDTRWIFYNSALIERSRENVMRHMLKPNLALLAKRQQKQDFSYAFVSDKVTESCVFESAYANNTVFPLYLYGNGSEQGDLFETNSKNIPSQNLSDKLWDYLGPDYIGHALPEDIFNYIYAILYSNSYRQKYQEFLKTDFPRIPFTKNYKLFQKLTELGKRLIDLHLLKSSELDKPIAGYHGKGNNVVGIRKFIGSDEAVEYHDIKIGTYWSGKLSEIKSAGIVLINDDKQFFGPVPEEVWNYYIGGYQVLDKWLKDHKGRELSSEEIKHYCKIVTAVKSTIEIQKEINRLYPKVEENLIKEGRK